MKKGFTLVELLAVLVIIAALSLIAVPSIINYINQSGSEIDATTKLIIENASQLYMDAHPGENCLSIQDDLINNNYLSSGIVDTKGNSLDDKYVHIGYTLDPDLGIHKYTYTVNGDVCPS